jgi:hypothetical protein
MNMNICVYRLPSRHDCIVLSRKVYVESLMRLYDLILFILFEFI